MVTTVTGAHAQAWATGAHAQGWMVGAQGQARVSNALSCEPATTSTDHTPITFCTYPSGDEMWMLDDARVSGHPLLMVSIGGAVQLWTPIAQRYMPQAFATKAGMTFEVVHPAQPPCTMLGRDHRQDTMYHFGTGGTSGYDLYVTMDGRGSCYVYF
jgi:hypothetical protein